MRFQVERIVGRLAFVVVDTTITHGPDSGIALAGTSNHGQVVSDVFEEDRAGAQQLASSMNRREAAHVS